MVFSTKRQTILTKRMRVVIVTATGWVTGFGRFVSVSQGPWSHWWRPPVPWSDDPCWAWSSVEAAENVNEAAVSKTRTRAFVVNESNRYCWVCYSRGPNRLENQTLKTGYFALRDSPKKCINQQKSWDYISYTNITRG